MTENKYRYVYNYMKTRFIIDPLTVECLEDFTSVTYLDFTKKKYLAISM